MLMVDLTAVRGTGQYNICLQKGSEYPTRTLLLLSDVKLRELRDLNSNGEMRSKERGETVSLQYYTAVRLAMWCRDLI
jgi:hypothetical protein